MPRGLRRGRKFWTGLVENSEDDGGSEPHQQVPDRHGVPCDTFRRWLYLLRAEKRGRRWRSSGRARRKAQTPLALSLVEVAGAPAADTRFEIQLPRGRCLRVPPSFDAEALRRLLAIFD